MREKIRFLAGVLFIVASSILLTIYIAWLFYPLEISWLGLENITYLKSSTIQYNFNVLMNYLTNPFVHQLSMPDFRSSDSGLHHFQAVKYLFHLTQAIFILTIPSVILFIEKVMKKNKLWIYRLYFSLLCILPLGIVGIAILIGFDSFFTLFHQLLFVGDSTWLFDPAKDPVILILPETFFLHAFILFAIFYEAFFLALYVKSIKIVN